MNDNIQLLRDVLMASQPDAPSLTTDTYGFLATQGYHYTDIKLPPAPTLNIVAPFVPTDPLVIVNP